MFYVEIVLYDIVILGGLSLSIIHHDLTYLWIGLLGGSLLFKTIQIKMLELDKKFLEDLAFYKNKEGGEDSE